MGKEARTDHDGQSPDKRSGKKRNTRIGLPVIDLLATGEGPEAARPSAPVDAEKTIADMRRNDFLWRQAKKNTSDKYRR